MKLGDVLVRLSVLLSCSMLLIQSCPSYPYSLQLFPQWRGETQRICQPLNVSFVSLIWATFSVAIEVVTLKDQVKKISEKERYRFTVAVESARGL